MTKKQEQMAKELWEKHFPEIIENFVRKEKRAPNGDELKAIRYFTSVGIGCVLGFKEVMQMSNAI